MKSCIITYPAPAREEKQKKGNGHPIITGMTIALGLLDVLMIGMLIGAKWF